MYKNPKKNYKIKISKKIKRPLDSTDGAEGVGEGDILSNK